MMMLLLLLNVVGCLLDGLFFSPGGFRWGLQLFVGRLPFLGDKTGNFVMLSELLAEGVSVSVCDLIFLARLVVLN